MLRLRYLTAAFLALGLLIVGGIGGYVLQRSRFLRGPEAAPAVVVEVFAAYPGTAAEEVERQVTIPLEVTLAGMPRLQSLRSKSIPDRCGLYARFEPGSDYAAARQEVINRLQFIQALPPGVVPQVGPGPGGEALRYLLTAPLDAMGRPVYAPHDRKTLQDGFLEREFRRLPGVSDVGSAGGTVKCYEINPDPDRLRRYGVTLQQLQTAVADANANVGGDSLPGGDAAVNVRGVGLFGGGADPFSAAVLTAGEPRKAAGLLRAAEKRRLHEIRALVVATVNNHPILVEDLVDGGRLLSGEEEGQRGVVVGSQSRTDRVACSGPGPFEDEDAVQGVVQLRPGEDAGLLRGVQARIRELNATAGQLLPGVRMEPYHDSTDGGEGALWVHGTFPANCSLERTADLARKVRELLRQLPEVERVVSQAGGSADGGDLQSSSQAWFFVGLKGGADVAAVAGRERPRSRAELIGEVDRLLAREVPGVAWLVTAKSPGAVDCAFPGTPAENLLEVVGPDLDELERLADKMKNFLQTIQGIEDVGAFPLQGQTNLEFRVDLDKCKKWGVSAADVSAVLQTALTGKAISTMREGERTFDITVRWPQERRGSETSILDIPVDVTNNQVILRTGPGVNPSPQVGSLVDTPNPIASTPRLRLRDLVTPVGKDGEPDPNKDFARPGTAAIYRDQGRRLIPVRFGVRGRSRADVRDEAAKKIAPLMQAPYRIEWGD
jgi:Cu/Ag efflux pump CusA